MSKLFSQVLAELRRGQTQADLTDAMASLVAAVKDTGKKGELTLTLTLKPGPANSMEVADEFKVKMPKHARAASLFFADKDNSLVRNNPNQPELELGGVDRETGEIRRSA